MKYYFLNWLFVSFFLVSCKQSPTVNYQIIPEPQSITYSPGNLKLSKTVKINFPKEATNEAGLLKEYLLSDFGLNVQTTDTKKNAAIVLSLTTQTKEEKSDSYTLQVGKKQITISSNSNAGIFYGIQSLRQIIQKRSSEFTVQLGHIDDFPAFSWRSFLLDEGRHFKGTQLVKRLLDEMALLKLNVFQWHLTEDQGWRIEIKKYPKLTEIGSYRDSTEINHFGSNLFDGKPHSGFYTQDEIREIVAYAANRHVLIVPEIEMPGHSSAAIASYPWLGTSGKQIKVPCKFGVQNDIYNVADPKVITFLSDVIDEIITLFPSSVIHIGGDEVRYDQWKSSAQVKSFMVNNGLKTPDELQIFFNNNISKLIAAKGKRMMGWNDVTGDKLYAYQSASTNLRVELPEGTIVQFWKGDPALIQKTIQKGCEIVNSFYECTYLDYDYKTTPMSKVYSFNPIPVGLPKEMKSKILGIGCQMWGEFIPTTERMNYQIFPRIAAFAECGWTSQEKKNYERFKRSLPYSLSRWKSEEIGFGPVE